MEATASTDEEDNKAKKSRRKVVIHSFAEILVLCEQVLKRKAKDWKATLAALHDSHIFTELEDAEDLKKWYVSYKFGFFLPFCSYSLLLFPC